MILVIQSSGNQAAEKVDASEEKKVPECEQHSLLCTGHLKEDSV